MVAEGVVSGGIPLAACLLPVAWLPGCLDECGLNEAGWLEYRNSVGVQVLNAATVLNEEYVRESAADKIVNISRYSVRLLVL